MQDIANYLAANWPSFLDALRQHLTVSFLSVGVAALIGLPLGVLCAQREKLFRFATGVFNTLRILPSLAILVLCIPIFGVGVTPAVIALTVLAIPPILINTAVGFETLPHTTLEAATAMGMSLRRSFLTVQIPLAAPLSLAGLKTATIEVIASATLAAYIGAGGLGTLIFTGIGLFRTDLLIVGGVSVAALSLLAGLAWSLLERILLRYRYAH